MHGINLGTDCHQRESLGQLEALKNSKMFVSRNCGVCRNNAVFQTVDMKKSQMVGRSALMILSAGLIPALFCC